MLDPSHGLNPLQLAAVGELERRVVAADGGRLKLEWADLRSRQADEAKDLLCWEDGRLLGFIGIYGPRRQTAELAGMVDPERRRQGIGRLLVAGAVELCAELRSAPTRILLVVPRNNSGGRELALEFGATLDHSEHALELNGPPNPGACDPAVELRMASTADLPRLSELYEDGFGDPRVIDAETLQSERARTVIVESRGEVIGTLRTSLDDDWGRIHGFVIASTHRGRGIGGDVLRRACETLRADGAEHVGLEVEVDNERALRLYLGIGFEPVTTEDYYVLPQP